MKNRYLIVATCCLVLINIILIWVLNRTLKNCETIKVVPSNQNGEYLINYEEDNNQQYFVNNIKLSFQNNLLNVNNPLVYFGNDSINSFRFERLLKENILVFRFSGNYCDACNSFVISKLKQHFINFRTNSHIILIGTEIPSRLKPNFFGKPILSLSNSDLGLPLEKESMPFLFILGKDKLVKMFFLPDKSLPKYTDSYLVSIKNYIN